MKIRLFVTGSAAFFAAWVAVTYVREVPHEGYPRLGKGSMPLSAEAEPEAPETPALLGTDGEMPTEIALAD
jgi:hypothetical protein